MNKHNAVRGGHRGDVYNYLNLNLKSSITKEIYYKTTDRKEARKAYTLHWFKKYTGPIDVQITLANVDRFSKFFHQLIRIGKFCMYTIRGFPPHLQYVATLVFLSFFTKWHVPPSRTSAEACLTGWPNAACTSGVGQVWCT